MDELLSTDQAAEILRVSPRTLEKFRVQGSGPKFFKIGRLVYYSTETLEEWKRSRLRTSTSDQGVK
jgi:predicted DNA-binding transcriptional regulator AlpA